MRAIHEFPPGTQPDQNTLIDAYAPEFREQIRTRLHACANAGEAFDFEAQLITAKRRPDWVRVIGQPERDSSGVIARISGALQDITARRLGPPNG